MLVPYFEVDVGNCPAPDKTTQLWLTNAWASAALARVTIWSDLGVPVLGFHIYLRGYGSQKLDLERTLCAGYLPPTGSAINDLGPASVFGTFPGCNATTTPGAAPVYIGDGAISPADVTDLQARLTGQSAPSTAKTTLLTVRNTEPKPALVFFTIWSDWAVPVLGFNVYLPGFDEHTINLHDVLCDGNLPQTGTAVSNLGAESIFGTFPDCNNSSTPGDAPVYPPGIVDASARAHLQAWLTGQQSPLTGTCAGSGLGDDIAVGYVTADNGTRCHLSLPSELEYYTNGYLSLTNQLQGGLELREAGGAAARSFRGLSLEADASLTGIAGGPTFYGRYNFTILGFEYSDGREPLPTTFLARWDADQAEATSLIVWREANAAARDVTCGSAPLWWPLDKANDGGLGAIVHFDDESNVHQSVKLPEFPTRPRRRSRTPCSEPIPFHPTARCSTGASTTSTCRIREHPPPPTAWGRPG